MRTEKGQPGYVKARLFPQYSSETIFAEESAAIRMGT